MNHTLAQRIGVCAIAMTGFGLVAVTGSGQGRRTWVRYDVEFFTIGSLLDPNCAATGTDSLVGTLVGLEPTPTHEPNQYFGTLRRSTKITTCGERTLADGREVVCSQSFTGAGFADVILKVEPDSQGGWLQYLDDRTPWDSILPPRPPGRTVSTVTGTCDPAEMAQLQSEYDAGETAGSPSGQPIEVTRLPPDTIPFTFRAKPPVSIWTLMVKRRRP